MKKIVIPMMVIMFTVLASVVMADEDGGEKAGKLSLFQKCDDTLKGTNHDSFGCPNIGMGPWPIFPINPYLRRFAPYSFWRYAQCQF